MEKSSEIDMRKADITLSKPHTLEYKFIPYMFEENN